jgi:RND family efflux transporter MFP subunit
MWKALRRYWWVILLSVGLILWLTNKFVWSSDRDKEDLYKVEVSDLVDEIILSGEVGAEEKVNLRFQSSGTLSYLGVKEGDMVKKYQVIASLDRRELQIRMQQLLNNYTKERHDFEQRQDDNENWQTKGMSDAERDAVRRVMDKYQKDLENSVLNVEAQNLSLKFANLWTPIAGIVTKVDVTQTGTNITPAGANFEIVNPETLIFTVTADQLEIVKFKIGQTGTLTMDAFPEKSLPVSVYYIGFTPKSGGSGTVYEMRLKLDDVSLMDQLRMGMTGDVSFVVAESKKAVVIPESAITDEGGKKYVRVKQDKEIEKRQVEVGLTVDGETEIISGLKKDEEIYY